MKTQLKTIIFIFLVLAEVSYPLLAAKKPRKLKLKNISKRLSETKAKTQAKTKDYIDEYKKVKDSAQIEKGRAGAFAQGFKVGLFGEINLENLVKCYKLIFKHDHVVQMDDKSPEKMEYALLSVQNALSEMDSSSCKDKPDIKDKIYTIFKDHMVLLKQIIFNNTEADFDVVDMDGYSTLELVRGSLETQVSEEFRGSVHCDMGFMNQVFQLTIDFGLGKNEDSRKEKKTGFFEKVKKFVKNGMLYFQCIQNPDLKHKSTGEKFLSYVLLILSLVFGSFFFVCEVIYLTGKILFNLSNLSKYFYGGKLTGKIAKKALSMLIEWIKGGRRFRRKAIQNKKVFKKKL